MTRTIDRKPSPTLGFLTVVEYPEHGMVGGYLVLNRSGRPLEFHCTAPIKPNRAQQILYGPTLEPYLFGEQIGRTLVSKSAAEPDVICTDQPNAMAVREFIEVPVALVMADGTNADSRVFTNAAGQTPAPQDLEEKTHRLDPPHSLGSHLTFRVGRNHLAVSTLAAADQQRIADRLGDLAGTFDLTEPFGRIREAIEEARRGGA